MEKKNLNFQLSNEKNVAIEQVNGDCMVELELPVQSNTLVIFSQSIDGDKWYPFSSKEERGVFSMTVQGVIPGMFLRIEVSGTVTGKILKP